MIMTKDIKRKSGLSTQDLKTGNLVEYEKESKTIHFYPAKKKGDNYLKYISGPQGVLNEDEISYTVKLYTNHVTWYCSQINLLLAADSPQIQKHADYIKNLILSIRHLALSLPIMDIRCYRGMNCSSKEIAHYSLGSILYIPSFLSTSRNKNKLYTSDNQNTLIVINISMIPTNAFSVNSKYSDFEETEEEALFSCYSKFKVLTMDQNKLFNDKVYEFYIELEYIEDYEEIKKYNCFCV